MDIKLFYKRVLSSRKNLLIIQIVQAMKNVIYRDGIDVTGNNIGLSIIFKRSQMEHTESHMG